MLYTGQFQSILREKIYTVEVVTDDSSSGDPVQLTFGPSPFVTNMDGSNDTLYIPVKYQSADMQIASKNSYLFDLYSSTAKENKVKLYDASSNVLFVGYTTPNTYSAPYDFETEVYTIEILDGLSILQYYDYTPVSGTKTFVSFSQIINHILDTCGCYKYFYFTRSIVINDIPSAYALERLYISEQNFFDEEEKPMKMKEVLEEICKFMNVTCVAHGEDVYIMNYDAIKNGVNNYRRYEIGTSNTANVSLSHSKTVLSDSYTGTGAQLDLDNTYSKVTVRDSLYTVESIIPSMFNDEDLINSKALAEDTQRWLYEYPVGEPLSFFDKGRKKGNNKTDDDVYITLKSRYYENKKYIHTYYNTDGSKADDSSDNLYPGTRINAIHDPVDASTKLGVIFAKYNIGEGKTAQEAYNALEPNSYKNYLTIPINHAVVANKVKLETRNEFAKPFFLSGDAKLIAKGSLSLAYKDKFYDSSSPNTVVYPGLFPDTSMLKGDYTGWAILWGLISGGTEYKIEKARLRLRVTLDVGNGEVENEIPFFPVGDASTWIYENKNHSDIFYQPFEIQDNVTYNDNINEKGYILNMNVPDASVLGVQAKLKIYGVDMLISDHHYTSSNPANAAYVQDFDIVGAMPAQNGNVAEEGVNETDTEYSYVIDDAYVNELSPIEFKVCTWDDKQLNYSAVAYKPTASSSSYKFLDKLKDNGLKNTSNTLGMIERAENLLCYRIVNQYKKPSKKLTLNLYNDYLPYTLVHENFLDTDMIIDSMNIDYVYDRAEVHLIEKK